MTYLLKNKCKYWRTNSKVLMVYETFDRLLVSFLSCKTILTFSSRDKIMHAMCEWKWTAKWSYKIIFKNTYRTIRHFQVVNFFFLQYLKITLNSKTLTCSLFFHTNFSSLFKHNFLFATKAIYSQKKKTITFVLIQ